VQSKVKAGSLGEQSAGRSETTTGRLTMVLDNSISAH